MTTLPSKRSVLLSLLAGLGFASQAFAFDFGIVGGINYGSLSSSSSNATTQAAIDAGTLGYSPQADGMFGFTVRLPLLLGFGLEGDALYVPQTQKLTVNNVPNSQLTTKSIQLVALGTFSMLDLARIGAGPYWGQGFGQLHVTSLDANGNAVANTDEDYSAASMRQTDFGLAFDLGARLPIGDDNHLLGDVRYLWGISNLNTDGITTNKTRAWQFLVGLSHDFF